VGLSLTPFPRPPLGEILFLFFLTVTRRNAQQLVALTHRIFLIEHLDNITFLPGSPYYEEPAIYFYRETTIYFYQGNVMWDGSSICDEQVNYLWIYGKEPAHCHVISSDERSEKSLSSLRLCVGLWRNTAVSGNFNDITVSVCQKTDE
jgi:hypothetical protein